MLYMVELEFLEMTRADEWNKWYHEHISLLLSMPGMRSAQRFKCLCPHPSPFLAIYSVPGPEFFESSDYTKKGGRSSSGKWQSTHANWHRNLYKGLELSPNVRTHEVLLVTEVDSSSPVLKHHTFNWLENAGLDGSIGRRGIAVGEAKDAKTVWTKTAAAIRPYAPLGARRTPEL